MMTCTSLLLPGSTMPLLGRTQYFLGLVVFTCSQCQRQRRLVPAWGAPCRLLSSGQQPNHGLAQPAPSPHLEGHALPRGVLQRQRAWHILAQLKPADTMATSRAKSWAHKRGTRAPDGNGLACQAMVGCASGDVWPLLCQSLTVGQAAGGRHNSISIARMGKTGNAARPPLRVGKWRCQEDGALQAAPAERDDLFGWPRPVTTA